MLLSAVCAGALAFGAVSSTASGAAPKLDPPKRYYLALGDSIAYGFQAWKFNAGLPPSAFNTGYVDVFAARLRALQPTITLVNYGCPGETTISFVTGPCLYNVVGLPLHDAFGGSQLSAAVAFLRSHPGQVSPITVTLWANDVRDFVESCAGDLSCVVNGAPAAIDRIAVDLRGALATLRSAAPSSEIIVSGVWDTFIGSFGIADPFFDALNRTIAAVAADEGTRFADTFALFNPSGDAAAETAAICTLTLLCSRGDSHPSDAGYRAIADSVFDASGYAQLSE